MDVIFQAFRFLIAFLSASLAQWQLFSHFNFRLKKILFLQLLFWFQENVLLNKHITEIQVFYT